MEPSKKHSSYLQDTPDFLRQINRINREHSLPKNALLVTLDVSSLFTNIPHADGLESVRKVLNEKNTQSVPTEFLIRLLELVLTLNIF